jgi:hypothetical protein
MAVAAAPRPRIAAEAALEALTAETVRHYKAVGGGVVPPALIEAIGEQPALPRLLMYISGQSLAAILSQMYHVRAKE